jgi:exonuclease SbcC
VRSLARLLGREIPAEVTDELVGEENQAVYAYVAACHHRADLAKRAARRADLLARHDQRRQLEATHAAMVAERDGQVRDLHEWADGLRLEVTPSVAETSDRLRDWVRVQEQKQEEQARQRELVARLDQLLEGRELTDWRADLARMQENAGAEPDTMPADIEQFRANAARRHEAVVSRSGQLVGRQQQLAQTLRSVAEAVEKEAQAERAVTQVESLTACIDAATAELNLARDRAQANIAPALERGMRPWIARVTDGRYLDVAVEPSNLTMKVTEANGAVRHAELLSQGTTEQLFLLLRMTLSQVLSGDVESAPLILDDVTVQSDHARTIAMLQLLHEISADHQVILFTQEQEVVTWAEGNVKDPRDKLVALPAPG